ncbi:ATP-binding cassette domain-containing protein [Neptunomonas sp.]|uniref:metal ABC transporter ATP-binding protein n=1 Tax=Neptunomonas sp. TaxID=1971898 RepID=UPI0025CCD74E|nr:ATP-binding cassette domain-containing protein [Neptunomonas sp.]
MIQCCGLQWGANGRSLTPPLDLQLVPGSLTAMIGRNGSGKSSLLKIMAGLNQPLRGQVKISTPLLGGISYLPQQQELDRQFPIRLAELVSAGFWRTRVSRRERQVRLQQALSDWGLLELEKQSLEVLSGGELQRALLARLSLTAAQVLLLDEPEVALDEHGQQLLWQHIARWKQQGRTIVIVSHNLASLNQKLDMALMISSNGCIFAPIDQFSSNCQTLEEVA